MKKNKSNEIEKKISLIIKIDNQIDALVNFKRDLYPAIFCFFGSVVAFFVSSYSLFYLLPFYPDYVKETTLFIDIIIILLFAFLLYLVYLLFNDTYNQLKNTKEQLVLRKELYLKKINLKNLEYNIMELKNSFNDEELKYIYDYSIIDECTFNDMFSKIIQERIHLKLSKHSTYSKEEYNLLILNRINKKIDLSVIETD